MRRDGAAQSGVQRRSAGRARGESTGAWEIAGRSGAGCARSGVEGRRGDRGAGRGEKRVRTRLRSAEVGANGRRGGGAFGLDFCRRTGGEAMGSSEAAPAVKAPADSSAVNTAEDSPAVGERKRGSSRRETGAWRIGGDRGAADRKKARQKADLLPRPASESFFRGRVTPVRRRLRRAWRRSRSRRRCVRWALPVQRRTCRQGSFPKFPCSAPWLPL